MDITKHTVVTMDYTLTDSDGNVLDTSENHGPISYIQGTGNIIPGLETALDGKSEGDKVSVTVEPQDAYGERDEDRVINLKRDQFTGVEKVEPGMQFQATVNNEQQILTVTDIEGDAVTVDANHPLAGMELNFDVEIRNVREATPEELDHGHVHDGDHGHDHE